ncbi:unnamed protein product [Clavelina lepadiformis]|uniref:Uncharacterized protein n=1 Tax=Clavelina lepadiformis TaxID=159417 RepID=A0ABP0G0K5_CLALP
MKTDQVLLLLVATCTLLSYCGGLHCMKEAKTENDIMILQSNTLEPTSTPCKEGQVCLRGEADIRLKESNINVTLHGGICWNETRCQDQVCKILVRDVLNELNTTTDLNIPRMRTKTWNCDYACCKTENCNNATVSEIREKQGGGGVTVVPCSNFVLLAPISLWIILLT